MIPNQPAPRRSASEPPGGDRPRTPAPPPGQRLLFAGGGTGGHLFPGIAVADTWRTLQPDCHILFAGSNRPLEREILGETGYASESIEFFSPRYALRQPLRFLRSWRLAKWRTRELLREFKPDIVIGLGGFASYPLLREATRRKIPIVLLEQNAVPGRVTSLFARKAKRICLSYSESESHLPRSSSTVVTGNPVRADILNVRVGSIEKPTLVICGGSQGSQVINRAMLKFAQSRGESFHGWHVRHQTGQIEAELHSELKNAYQKQSDSFELVPFFSRPGDLYEDATLLVGRAGGTTLAEVTALNLPALLVPIANAIRNHQHLNATAHLACFPGRLVHERSERFEQEFASALEQLLQAAGQRESLSISQPAETAADLVVNELIHALPHAAR